MSTGTRKRKHIIWECIRKKLQGSIRGKTKITDNVKIASLSHSTKQGNSNSNIINRVKKMGGNISTNNRGHEDRKISF